MRKFKCIKVNKTEEDEFTVGKIYETDDNMLNYVGDSGYFFDKVKLIEKGDVEKGLEFEEITEDNKQEKENNMKFKVGDVVKGNEKADERYSYSDSKTKRAEVIKVNTNSIVIKILEHELKSEIGEEYTVVSDCFDLVGSTQSFTITVSDTITTLKSADKTVEIKRYYTDKHDVKVAIDNVVKKYFDEVEREYKEKEIKDYIAKFLKENNYDESVKIELIRKVVK